MSDTINEIWVTSAERTDVHTISIRTDTATMVTGFAEPMKLPKLDKHGNYDPVADEKENHYLIGCFSTEDLLKIRSAINKHLKDKS